MTAVTNSSDHNGIDYKQPLAPTVLLAFCTGGANVPGNRKGINMTHEIGSNSSFSNPIAARPRITSYDSGYEHSLDHYVDVKLLLQNAEGQEDKAPATFAEAA
jgi:hypothetical protein